MKWENFQERLLTKGGEMSESCLSVHPSTHHADCVLNNHLTKHPCIITCNTTTPWRMCYCRLSGKWGLEISTQVGAGLSHTNFLSALTMSVCKSGDMCPSSGIHTLYNVHSPLWGVGLQMIWAYCFVIFCDFSWFLQWACISLSTKEKENELFFRDDILTEIIILLGTQEDSRRGRKKLTSSQIHSGTK